MKRLVIAGVLFLFIILICFAGNFTVLGIIKDFDGKIEKCERLYLAGEVDNARKCAEEFQKDWYDYSKTVSAFCNHRPIDDIGILVSSLPEAVGAENRFEFASTISRIKSDLKLIYKEQSFNLENFY